MIQPDTLGNKEVYSCLVGLSDLLNNVEENQRTYIISFLQKFNEICKRAEAVEDKQFRFYVLKLIEQNYRIKLEPFDVKFGKDIKSHTSNYVITKLRIMKNIANPPAPLAKVKYLTCGIFLIDGTGKFLIAHPTNAEANRWSVPKGLINDGESECNAAKREFLEETGIDINKLNTRLVFEMRDVRYNDPKKALSAFIYITNEIIDPTKCFCDSMVHPKVGDPFPENDAFEMIDKTQLDKIHYTQKKVFETFLQS